MYDEISIATFGISSLTSVAILIQLKNIKNKERQNLPASLIILPRSSPEKLVQQCRRGSCYLNYTGHTSKTTEVFFLMWYHDLATNHLYQIHIYFQPSFPSSSSLPHSAPSRVQSGKINAQKVEDFHMPQIYLQYAIKPYVYGRVWYFVSV